MAKTLIELMNAGNSASANSEIHLTAPNREGLFIWRAGDMSSQVSSDPLQGVYVAKQSDPTGSQGAWERHLTGATVNADWFGLAGDGVTNDYPLLKTLFNTFLHNRPEVRRVTFTRGKTYQVADLSSSGQSADALRIKRDNLTVDGDGATIRFADSIVDRDLFILGNNAYVPGEDEYLPTGITIRRFRFDLRGTPQGSGIKSGNLCPIFMRHPCAQVIIEDNECFRSLSLDLPTGDDNWFVNFENIHAGSINGSAAGSFGWPEHKASRLHDVTLRRNVVRNNVQLCGSAGRGINGLTIVDNEVHHPQSNGIAITGNYTVCRLENVLISRNKIYDANGRGIYVQNDSIADSADYDLTQVKGFQSYARNVTITDNVLEGCATGIRIGTHIQGQHGLLVDGNQVRRTSANGGALIIESNLYAWAKTYFGSGQTVPRSAFDPATDQIAMTTALLQDGHSVSMVGLGIGVGIAAATPYFLKKVAGGNAVELYTDPSLTTKVDITALSPAAGTPESTAEVTVTPTIGAAAFDQANQRVNFVHHFPRTGVHPVSGRPIVSGAVTIKKATADSAMPLGLASDVPYYVSSYDPLPTEGEAGTMFELYETCDPETGELSDKVWFGPGASGYFSVLFCSIASNVTIGSDNNFDGIGICSLSHIRHGKIKATFSNERLRLGKLFDVNFSGSIRDGQAQFNNGGCLGVVFEGMEFWRRADAAAGSDRYLMRSDIGNLSHYDITFLGCNFTEDFRASEQKGSPIAVFGEATIATPANRDGPGWRMVNCVNTIYGTPASTMSVVHPSARPNCADVFGNRFTEAAATMGGVATDVITYSGSAPIQVSDVGRTITFSGTGARDLVVPPASTSRFPAGAWVDVVRTQTGTLSIVAGTGVVIRSKVSTLPPVVTPRYGRARLTKLAAADEWLLTGDIA